MSSIIFQMQSTLILSLLWFGVYKRKRRNLHVKIMSFAIIWDIVLVLQIELTRSAIAKASKVVSNSFLLNFHVAIAVSTVILYGVMVYLGRKILNGQMQFKTAHKYIGMITLLMRTSTYVTSFIVGGN